MAVAHWGKGYCTEAAREVIRAFVDAVETIYLFENMTMLDGYAPLQVLSFVPDFECLTFADSTSPLSCDAKPKSHD